MVRWPAGGCSRTAFTVPMAQHMRCHLSRQWQGCCNEPVDGAADPAAPFPCRCPAGVQDFQGAVRAEEGVHGGGPGPDPAALRRAGGARHRPRGRGVRPRGTFARRCRHRRSRRAARPVHRHGRHRPRAGAHHRPAARRRPARPRRRGRAPRPPRRPRPRPPRRGRRGRVRPTLGPTRAQPRRLRVHDLLRGAVPARDHRPAARALRRRPVVRAHRRRGPLRPVVLRAPAPPAPVPAPPAGMASPVRPPARRSRPWPARVSPSSSAS